MEIDHFDYLTWDGTPWRCFRVPPDDATEQAKFLHAPDGNMQLAHEDTIINYRTWDGSNWTAQWQGDDFYHTPAPGNNLAAIPHQDSVINYLGWDSPPHWQQWQVQWNSVNKLFNTKLMSSNDDGK